MEPLIKTIRERYATIVGKEISDLQIDTLDMSEPMMEDDEAWEGHGPFMKSIIQWKIRLGSGM